MSYKNWKILKTEQPAKQAAYTTVSAWCNENNYHIAENEIYYFTQPNAPAPEPTPQEVIKAQIVALEEQITERNIRGAILGDEFAVNKITQIETQIAELRRQLEVL